MSSLLGGSGITPTFAFGPGWPDRRNDDILQEPSYRTTMPGTRIGRDRDADVLWIRSSFPNQIGVGGNGCNSLDSAHQEWEWDIHPTGCHVRKKVTGIAYDFNGKAIPSAVVQLFNTSTGLLVDTQTADGAGNFTVEDPNNTTNFMVGYAAGAAKDGGDEAGTSVNTLTGS
jgi:hypothetical protein